MDQELLGSEKGRRRRRRTRETRTEFFIPLHLSE